MGYKIEAPDDFSNGIRKYFAQAGLERDQISEVARLINQGARDKAIVVLENAAYKNAKQNLGDDYISESTVSYSNAKGREVEMELARLGSELPVGVVKGTMEGWLGRFKGEEATRINAKVKSLVAEMRNRLSGSAVTPSEEKFLESLIPKLSDSPANFVQKINELRTNPLTKLNRERAQYGLPEIDRHQLFNRAARVRLYSLPSEVKEAVNDPYFFSEI